MVKSINSQVDLTVDATWFRSLPSYGKVMVGDKAFEFYNERNVVDYVQIPWDEVTFVVVDVKFKGRYIPRFEIRTREAGNFIFATRETKKTLQEIRKHIPADHMRKALTIGQKLKRRFTRDNK